MPNPTAQTIITQSLIDLGVYAPGEPVSATESANGLAKLNIMLDNWSGARDLVYEIATAQYALTANQEVYPIGPSATAPFNVARPIKIENADILVPNISTTGVVRFRLKFKTQDQFFAIQDRSAAGKVPEFAYYEPSQPNGNIYLSPIPLCNVTTQIELGTWVVIGQYATLATAASLPPAYYRAILLGLQLELLPTYERLIVPGISQQRSQQFQEALSVVRSINSAVQMEQLMPTGAPTK